MMSVKMVLSVLVVGATLSFAPAAAGQPATADDGALAVLVGAGGGLNGIGDLPGALIEAHAGGGWRTSSWLFAGLGTFAHTEGKAILGDWSISRRALELVGLLALYPISHSAFHVFGQLGVGTAGDRLRVSGAETSASQVTASFGVGVGWGPAALTVRYVTPKPRGCSITSSCYESSGGTQLLLSLTFDVAAAVRRL